MATIFCGNAQTDCTRDGWIVGHFMPQDDLRYSQNIEVSYRFLTKGTARKKLSDPVYTTTCWFVLSGRLCNTYVWPGSRYTRITCRDNQYAIVSPGARHRWVAQEDSKILAIRWPSAPKLQPKQVSFDTHVYGKWNVINKNQQYGTSLLFPKNMPKHILQHMNMPDVIYGRYPSGQERKK